MKEYENTALPAGERARALLSEMTLREKIGQLNQRLYGFRIYERRTAEAAKHSDGEGADRDVISGGNTAYEDVALCGDLKEEVQKYGGLGALYGLYRADPWAGKDYETGLAGVLAKKAYNEVQRYVTGHSRHHIPALMSSECPHGHQALDGYLLPVNLAAGASFDPALVKRAYGVCGMQMKALGVHLALLSMLDVLRDPRWGRSEECYGEDPYLCARMAAAAVEGVQEKGPFVVAKHFAAQGETTGGVNASAARIGERELREIHFPPMQACAKAGVKGVMAAYNEIDGVYCHANSWLLRDVLRGEMGFDGIVMSDGCAIDQLDGMTGDNTVSGALALSAGVDMGLWDTAFGRLEEAVERGIVETDRIDEAVLRVLTLKFEQGLFERPFLEETDEAIRFSYEEYPESLELARESAVLLKNEGGLLPLKAGRFRHDGGTPRLAVIGPNADSLYNQLGDYTPPLRREDGVTVLDGVRRIFEGGKSVEIPSAGGQTLKPDEAAGGWRVGYAPGCYLRGRSDALLREAVDLAEGSDTVLLVLGGSSSRFSGAAFDVNGAALMKEPEEGNGDASDSVTGQTSGPAMDCGEGMDCADISLPEEQLELLRCAVSAGKPVITIVICGRPLAIQEVCRLSDAVLMCFYPGPRGGQAAAELLAGLVNPSGGLPVSLPVSTGQIPVCYNHKASFQAMRYMDTQQGPLFPFGYGLDYTSYEYSDVRLLAGQAAARTGKEEEGGREAPRLSESGDAALKVSAADLAQYGVSVAARVKNTGGLEGCAVPMLYVSDPAASVVRRVKELKAFDKIKLSPGEEKEIILHLPKEAFCLYNNRMEYTAETGMYGLSLSEKGNTVWRGEFKLCT